MLVGTDDQNSVHLGVPRRSISLQILMKAWTPNKAKQWHILQSSAVLRQETIRFNHGLVELLPLSSTCTVEIQ